MNPIEKQIQEAAKKVLKRNVGNIQKHSHGAYSDIYIATCENTGVELIVKVYFKTGFMMQEVRELEELRKWCSVAVPQVYGCFLGDDNLSDIFFMEYMPGVPVRFVKFDTEADKNKIADAVVDAHISIHNAVNPSGFGDLDSKAFSQSWEHLFHNRISGYYRYITELKNSPISDKARDLIDYAYHNFDNVFAEPVREARLIHGDFKMKNVLIDPKTFKVTAVFDPAGCCYGDREADLFPYTNAKDAKFGFLENYASKVRLSEKFPLKNNYYFLWNELKHFVMMGYCFNEIFEELGQSIYDMLKYGW